MTNCLKGACLTIEEKQEALVGVTDKLVHIYFEKNALFD
jgi:hypothetical protein